MSVLNVLATWLSLYAEQRVDFIQEIANQELTHIGVRLSPTNLFHSLNLWCKDLVPQKRGKGIAVSELNVSATGLSLYAEQRVDFVQEIGDKELIHKGVRLSPNKSLP